MDPLIKKSRTDLTCEAGDADCVSRTDGGLNFEKKRPQTHEILSTVLFVAIIYVLAMLMLFMPDKDYSEEENRLLKQFPELSSKSDGDIFDRISNGRFLDRLMSGEFNSDMVSYFSDQFPFRNVFIGIKALSECIMLGGENNGFFASDDGYIIERCDYIDYTVLDEYRTVIENFSLEMAHRDIPVTVSVVGRIFDVMTEMLPDIYRKEDVSGKSWAELEKRLGVDENSDMPFSYVDMRDVLSDGKALERQIYYRTDHHWTTYGAYLAYCALADSLGFIPYGEDTFDIETVSEDFYGTSWRSSGMKWVSPDKIEFWRYNGDDGFVCKNLITGERHEGFYFDEYLFKTDKYSALLGENSALLHVYNDDSNIGERETLLLVKDSFSHSLVPFLARHFDLLLLDCRYYNLYDRDLISEYGIDKVLFIGYVDTFIERSSGFGVVSLIY